MNGAPSGSLVAGAAVVAVGLAAGGALKGAGLSRARLAHRSVTVKGISERDVRADTGIWPLRIVAADNDLGQANRQLAASQEKARSFLDRQGIPSTDAAVQGFRVADAFADPYRPAGQVARRYVVEVTVHVRSAKPDLVLSASQKLPMIAEATARGREAAEQFARDPKSRVGGIRRASQGLFEILPRDQAPGIREEGQIEKRVRVVSTVEHFLKDRRLRPTGANDPARPG